MIRETDRASYGVVVIHYGDAERTRRCLDSLTHLDPAPDAVVLVWNGPGSPIEHPEVTETVAPESNLGFAGGANRGIEELARWSVESVLLLNNDTSLEHNPVARQLEMLATHPDVAAIGPRLVTPGGDVWHDGARIGWPHGKPEDIDSEGEVFEVDFVCGCAPLLRLSAFLDVGGFDERYFLTYEDADLGLRLKARGWQLLHDTRAVVVHEGGASLDVDAGTSRYYRLRNRILFSREHSPDPAATEKANRWLELRSKARAIRWMLTGRRKEASAVFSALRDARSGTFGAWNC